MQGAVSPTLCFPAEPFHPLPWQAAGSLFVQGSRSSPAAAEEINWKFKVCFSGQSYLEEEVCAEEAAWPLCREQCSCTEAALGRLLHSGSAAARDWL